MLKTLVAVSYLVAVALSATCNPNPCGAAAYADIVYNCAMYTGWNQKNCQCMVTTLSGGNYHACNINSGGTQDIGFWQVNSTTWASCSSGNPPCDLFSNLECAIDVFLAGGFTWKFWPACSTCGCCRST
eukprot:TRINITY_DN4004_c0_g1_i1.p1 TRINITY_DN4004_c0_g1~~TRINITY_DN4004_c0_g1_i1.p1  ORF type:complete len:129 (-),score=14.04 TRINITY_DN4004_c0_g1_i1:74-460(-)